MNTRIAIVTGAARGLGTAVAQRLALDGMAVAVLDIDEVGTKAVVDEIVGAGGRAVSCAVDVTDEESVHQAVGYVADQLGTPTALVNNAGIIRDDILHKMTLADWDAVLSVHLGGSSS